MLVHEEVRSEHHAIADNVHLTTLEDTRWNRAQHILLAFELQRVAGIRTTLETGHHIVLGGQHVDHLTFSLIAPLQTQQDINFSFVHNLSFSFIDFFMLIPLRDLGLTGAADTIHIEGETILAEPSCLQILHGRADLGRLELTHLATHRTDLMAMAGIIVAGLVLRRTLKAVADNQAQFHKQVEGVVHRGPAHVEIHILDQLRIQLVQRKMAIDIIDSSQDSITLQRLAMIVHLKIVIQDTLHGANHTFLIRYCHRKNCQVFENRTKVHIFKETKDSLFIKNLN